MEVKILKIYANNQNTVKVSFSTEFGNAEGFWDSGDIPNIGKTYNVEIEIDNITTLNQNIVRKDNGYSINYKDNLICIIGKVESVDEDGYGILRIGNSIIPFFVSDTTLRTNEYIEIYTLSITLTPIEQ